MLEGSWKVNKLMVLCKETTFHIWFGSKFQIGKVSTLFGGGFLMQTCIFSQHRRFELCQLKM